MSTFNKDQELLSGRKNKLKDVKVPLRDQIVKKLFSTVKDLGVGRKVNDAWHLASSNIASILERQQIFLRDLDEHIPASAEQPFGGSSNLHLPMPFIVSKTYHARFMTALLGVDPPFSLKARRADGVDKVPLVEDLLSYTIKNWANYNRGLEEAVDTWVWNWVTTGTGIMKVRWHNEYIRYMDVESIIVPGPPKIVVGEDGSEQLEPTVNVEEREVSVTEPKFKGPMVEWVNLEDFRMMGGNGDPDLADIVMQRSYLTASDLWSGVDQGFFDEDEVKEVIQGGKDNRNHEGYGSIKTQRAVNAGKGNVETEADLDRYEIIEAHLRMDVDGSGINSDIIVWVHLHSGNIIRATYAHRVMPGGERPYAVAHFHKRPGEEFGVGLLEILHPLSVELDAMHNMRIDWGMISNMPYFFYRASSSLDPETMQLEPGMGIPVDNPQTDIFFPQIGNRSAFGAQEEAAIQSYIERLTGISDLSLGVVSGVQGATRTASGVRAILGESNANLDVHLRRINRGWKKILRSLFLIMQNRIDPGFVFRVTGDAGQDLFKEVYPQDLQIDLDFDLSANSSNSNKAVQIETAQQLVQITGNPLNIQLGITGPTEAYNAVKNYLSLIGAKDYSRYIKKPQGYSISLTPEEAFNRVVRGQEVSITPEMDHDGMMAFFQAMIDAQSQIQTLNEEQIGLAINQIKKHAAIKQALEQQAQQMAVQQQMINNQAMAQGGAPQLANPLADANAGALPQQ